MPSLVARAVTQRARSLGGQVWRDAGDALPDVGAGGPHNAAGCLGRMMQEVPVPLGDDEVTARLVSLPGWFRHGDEITRTFSHTYHECVHLAMYVAARAREVSRHPDMHITWQRIRFVITTHDAGGKLTEADFSLAQHIDHIAAAHGATPVTGEMHNPASSDPGATS